MGSSQFTVGPGLSTQPERGTNTHASPCRPLGKILSMDSAPLGDAQEIRSLRPARGAASARANSSPIPPTSSTLSASLFGSTTLPSAARYCTFTSRTLDWPATASARRLLNGQKLTNNNIAIRNETHNQEDTDAHGMKGIPERGLGGPLCPV